MLHEGSSQHSQKWSSGYIVSSVFSASSTAYKYQYLYHGYGLYNCRIRFIFTKPVPRPQSVHPSTSAAKHCLRSSHRRVELVVPCLLLWIIHLTQTAVVVCFRACHSDCFEDGAYPHCRQFTCDQQDQSRLLLTYSLVSPNPVCHQSHVNVLVYHNTMLQ